MPLTIPKVNDSEHDEESESQLTRDELVKVLNLLYVRALGEQETASSNLRDLSNTNPSRRDLMHHALGRQIVANWEGQVHILHLMRLLLDGQWHGHTVLEWAVRDVRAFSRSKSAIISVR